MNRLGTRSPLPALTFRTRALLLLLTLPLLRCEPPPTESAPVALALAPVNPRIAQSTGQRFAVRATFADGRIRDVAAQAQLVVLDAQDRPVPTTSPLPGLVEVTAPGRYRVRATLAGQVTETLLEVTAATLKSVALSPLSPAIALGTTQQFTLTGLFSDGTSQDVTALSAWSLKSLVGTGVAVVNSSGLCTSKAVGKVTVSGRYKTKTASTNLEVTPAVVTVLAVSPSTPAIAKGTTLQFSASAVFSDGTTQDVTTLAAWSVQDIVGVGVAEIDAAGSALGRAVGQVAVSAEYAGQLATTTMTVTPAVPLRLTIAPAAASIAKGTTQKLSATAAFSDGSTQDVTLMATWTTSDLAGSGVASIDARGVATGKAVGAAALGAAYSGLSATATLTVTPAVLTSLALSPAVATIARGTTGRFVASGTYSDGSVQDVSAVCTWSIADVTGAGVASIDSGGTATGKAEGKAAVTATYLAAKAAATLVVTPPIVTGVEVTPGLITIGIGKQQQFHAVATLSDGTTQDVSTLAMWSTMAISGPGFASVDATGLVTGKSAGWGTVTATYRGLPGYAILTVATFATVTVPTTQVLWQIWGASASDVWIGGANGTLLHFDGTTWKQASTLPGTVSVNTVWGSGPKDVWFGGDNGLLFHYDGTTFQSYPALGANSIWGLWGSSATDVWATSALGVWHFDGTRWTQKVSDLVTTLWGSSASNVWFFGSSLYRWNGSTMETRPLPIAAGGGIWAMAGTGPGDIWAVGSSGTIVHYNGTAWSTVASPTSQFLVGVSVLSTTDILVTGYGGTILRGDGTTFTAVESPTGQNLMSVFRVAGATFITGFGGTLLRNF